MNTYDPQLLLGNLARVRNRIDAAAHAAGRDPKSVTLVAVSKVHGAEAVAILANSGQLEFGESYVQEALGKQDELAEQLAQVPVKWHFIGHLQSNKAKYVAGRFGLIHTVSSLKLAQGLHKKASSLTVRQPVLLQVNIGDEPQKSGVAIDGLSELAGKVCELDHLELQGLMCLPPFFDDGKRAEPFFARLRELKEGLEQELGISLPHLSMGMSGDCEQAVAQGATLVRVGTDIFGQRPYKQ